MKSAAIRVLVIDDSLFMRTLVSDFLNSDPAIEVIAVAQSGEEAMKKLSTLKPDCITLDLMMPGWGGLTTLKHIMNEHPTPVIILAAQSKKAADTAMECLDAGAVSFVAKPSGELSLDIELVKHVLIDRVKAASKVEVGKLASLLAVRPKRPRGRLKPAASVVVIGASTGGPQTLELILGSMPEEFPAPMIIVQHMPSVFFTKSFAEHLDKTSDLSVRIAEEGGTLKAGSVYVAPAGYELTFGPGPNGSPSSNGGGFACFRLTEEKPDLLTPSIDKTMTSAAEVFGGSTVGVILTGLGQDGREGMKAIKNAGGRTIAQDHTSLIFGMPKAVIDAGVADKVLPASEVARALMELV